MSMTMRCVSRGRKFKAVIAAAKKTPLPQQTISIMTYNILAQKYAQTGWHNYCPSKHLKWESRKSRLLEEIEAYGSDIICLQEVESVAFSQDIKPWMEERGYQGHYLARQYGENVQHPPEGVALFYRRDVFDLLHLRPVIFSSSQTEPSAPSAPSPSSSDSEDSTATTTASTSQWPSLDRDWSPLVSLAEASGDEADDILREFAGTTATLEAAAASSGRDTFASSSLGTESGRARSSSATTTTTTTSGRSSGSNVTSGSGTANTLSGGRSGSSSESRGGSGSGGGGNNGSSGGAGRRSRGRGGGGGGQAVSSADGNGASTSGRGGGGGRGGSNNEFWSVFTRRHEGAILALLRHRPSQRPLLAAVTHLFWNPAFPDVKAFQAAVLCKEMASFLRQRAGQPPEAVPVVLAGDFNSLSRKRIPDSFDPQIPRGSDGLVSGVYALLTHGRLPPDHPDHPATRRRPGETSNSDFRDTPLSTSGLNLASVYQLAHGRDPPLTTRTATFAGCLDYIFVSPNHFEVTGTLELPYQMEWSSSDAVRDPLSDVDFPPIPNDVYPSDHLSLAAVLQFRS